MKKSVLIITSMMLVFLVLAGCSQNPKPITEDNFNSVADERKLSVSEFEVDKGNKELGITKYLVAQKNDSYQIEYYSLDSEAEAVSYYDKLVIRYDSVFAVGDGKYTHSNVSTEKTSQYLLECSMAYIKVNRVDTNIICLFVKDLSLKDAAVTVYNSLLE